MQLNFWPNHTSFTGPQGSANISSQGSNNCKLKWHILREKIIRSVEYLERGASGCRKNVEKAVERVENPLFMPLRTMSYFMWKMSLFVSSYNI